MSIGVSDGEYQNQMETEKHRKQDGRYSGKFSKEIG
jgi:hypothetical protein